ncbi:GMC oxidoreductase [Apiospora aurea]|uniref:GMC oxidoreductase n=1 Tax=Apiospora aurea TaxID=335848 RepID=A0ABR1QGH7_9PEZI
MRNVVDGRRPLVVLPRKYLDEVRNAPQNEMSFPRFMENLSILKAVGGPLITDELCHATRVDLNRALREYGPGFVPMARQGNTPADFCSTSPKADARGLSGGMQGADPIMPRIMLYPLLLQIFNRIGQRVLVGPELGRNEDWLHLTQNYTTSLLQGTNTVRAKYPPPDLRWMAKYLERDVKMVYKQRQRGAALLGPILKARLAAKAEKVTESHDDAIEWLIDEYHRTGKKVTAEEIAQDQLGLTMAAIHNTAATVLSTLYDLIDHPASLDDIRTEARQAMDQHGGNINRAALQSLHHLDSFMTESLRMQGVWGFLFLGPGKSRRFRSSGENGDVVDQPNGPAVDFLSFFAYRRGLCPSPSSGCFFSQLDTEKEHMRRAFRLWTLVLPSFSTLLIIVSGTFFIRPLQPHIRSRAGAPAMKVFLLVFVAAMARLAVSQGIISPEAQQRHAASEISQHPRGLFPEGLTTMPPACALKCQMQSAPPTNTSLSNPIQALCSRQVDPAAAEKLKVCLASSCTLTELLQARRFTAELCHEPETNISPMILAVMWVGGCICIIGILLRVLARTALLETSKFEASRWGWDDTAITVALASNVAAGIITSLAIAGGGFGRDVWMLTPDEITYGIKMLIITEPIYYFSLGQVKVAILLFYLRIFPRQSGHQRFRVLCWVMIAAVAIYTVANMLILIFQCWPVSYAWTRAFGHQQGTCQDLNASVSIHTSLNMAADWTIFIMPIKNLVQLKMKRAKKVLAIAVLAFGLGGSVCSIFRLVELVNVWQSDFRDDPNITMRLAKFFIWSAAEVTATLFCACMPMAVQVVRRLTKKADGSRPQKLGQKDGSYGSYYNQADDSTSTRRTAATQASRRGHLSMELTNISELALHELCTNPSDLEAQTPAVQPGDHGSGGACEDEEKGIISRHCVRSRSGSWDSARPGTVI